MRYQQIVPPEIEPIVIGELRDYLRLDESCCGDEDLNQMIAAARGLVEADCSRQLITATWDLYLDKFPYADGGVIELERPPIQSVTFIKYYDADNALQTLDTAAYEVDTVGEPGRVKPAYGYSWPTTRCKMNAVQIRFVAGYSPRTVEEGEYDPEVPELAIQAMSTLIAHWNLNREAVGQVGPEVELSYRSIIWKLKWRLM